MARGIGQRDRPAVRQAEEVALLDPGRVDHRREVLDHMLEIEVRRLPVRHPEAAHVRPDEAMPAHAFAQPVRMGRAARIDLDMSHPARRLDQREAAPPARPGDPGPVAALAIADFVARRGRDPGRRRLGRTAGEELAADLGEHRPGRLGLEQDVVAAFQRDERRSGNVRRQLLALREGHRLVVARMEDQRRGRHLGQQLANVDRAERPLQPHRILGRGGLALHLVEPAHLLGARLGDVMIGEELAIGGAVRAPADLGEGDHRLAPGELGGIGAHRPARRIAVADDEMPHPPGMTHRISDGDRRALADRQQVEAFELEAIGDAFEVVDEGLERQVGRIPVAEAVAALVVADERAAARELLDPVPPQRAVPVVLDMVEPVRGLDRRRPLAGHRISEPRAVARRAIEHLLRRQVAAQQRLRAFLLLGLDPAPPGRRRDSIFALERAVERGLAVEADRISDVGGVLLAVAQHVRRHAHPPARAIAHRRLAEQLAEPLSEHGARDSRLAGQALDVEILGVALVDDRQRLRHRRVGKSAQPAARSRREPTDIFADRLGDEQLGEPGDDLGRRRLLGDEAHRAVEPLRLAARDIEREERGQGIEQGVRAAFGGAEEAAPDLGLRPVGPVQHMVHAVRRDPADFADVGRREAAAAGQEVRVVARKDGDSAGAQGDGRLAVDLDDRPAGTDVMVADQGLGRRKEGRAMVGRELGQHAEIAGQISVDHDSAGQAKRAQDLVENVHRSPGGMRRSGVSVNLSGTAIILAKPPID